jgi:hypothetical protein
VWPRHSLCRAGSAAGVGQADVLGCVRAEHTNRAGGRSVGRLDLSSDCILTVPVPLWGLAQSGLVKNVTKNHCGNDRYVLFWFQSHVGL